MRDYSSLREHPPIGTQALGGPDLVEPLPVLTWWYGTVALSKTREILSDLEKATFSGINVETLNCIGLWFWFLESGISTAFKLVASVQDQRKYHKLIQKFIALPKLVGSKEQPKIILINELQEFCKFRNQVFHDLYYPAQEKEYSHTKFSKVPAFANEIDLLEAMRISLNCLNYYRYFIIDIDLINKNAEDDFLGIFDKEIIPRFNKFLEARGFQHIEFRAFDRELCIAQTKNVYQPLIRYEGEKF